MRKAIAVTSGAARHACLPGTARAQHLAARHRAPPLLRANLAPET